MLRTLTLATFVLAVPGVVLVQTPSVLHIRATVLDATRGPIPVARHALLISDVPVTAAPHRAVTSLAGTADVNLRPGRYIVESDRPVAIDGRAYEWAVTVEVAAGRETTLELTTGNARIGAVTSDATTVVTAAEPDPSALLTRYEHSVFGLWTPHAYASGFLVGTRGLVATSQRAIGDHTAVEVQVSATVKVAAVVLSTDAIRDVAVLWIDPAAVADLRPVPVACGPAAASTATNERDLLTIDTSFRRPRGVTSVLSSATVGGPVFTTDGTLVGVASSLEDGNDRRRGETRVVGALAMCEALVAAEAKMSATTRPDAALLPVDPAPPLPITALTAAAAGRAVTLTPYRISSSDFDIVFITPLLLAGAEAQRERMVGRDDGDALRAVMEFGNWSDYVTEVPPVLLIRVTPRLVEGLWMKIARGAAMTQGTSLPPIKRLRPGFSSMRVLCGGRAITPIHPFKIQGRLSEAEAIDEGLYVFDPAAIGPHCGRVTLVLSSVKDPNRTETLVVDPAVINRIAQDLASLPAAP